MTAVTQPAVVVERAGLRTTVQDAGRPGFGHLGVPRSGAADALSRRLANVLVGNAADAAVLETTFAGPALRFEQAAVVACTGAVAPVRLDAEEVPFGAPVRVGPGQVLDVGSAALGLRTYIAVAGGFDVPPVLGSRSTDTLSGLGPPVVTTGERLPLGTPSITDAAHTVPGDLLASVLGAGRRAVRLVPGPRVDWLSPASRDALFGAEFVVSPASDRVGVRLTGLLLSQVGDGEAETEGMVTGAVQLPPGGEPVVLLADHAVTGGYPVVAVVATVDLPLIGQARPGTSLRFAEVSAAVAREAHARVDARVSALGGY
ncbi:MAG: hypothetical protein QOC73_1042 [Actinomycetota bacterium]|nr:hypothetical protein [Actinomycetota bacterium]